MRFSCIREIMPNGDSKSYYGYASYRAQKLAAAQSFGGIDALAQLQLWFDANEQIERQLETDFNLRQGGAEGLLLMFRSEGEVRSLLLDPPMVQACNHPRSTIVLTMCSSWRFNYCRIYHPNFIMNFHYASQPQNFASPRG